MLIRSVEWSMLIVPWFSLLLLSKENIRTYFPVAIFTALLMTIYHEIAFTQKFWIGNNQTIFPWLVSYASFVYGPFTVGALWIFRFTFGRFWLYCLTNIVVDGLFLFVLSHWFESMGFYHLVTRDRGLIFMDWFIVSILAYSYQVWQSGTFGKRAMGDDGTARFPRERFFMRRKAR